MAEPTTNVLLSGEQHVTDPRLSARIHNDLGWDGTTLVWNIGRRRAFVVCGYSRGNPRHARNGEPEDYVEVGTRAHNVGEAGVVEVKTVPAYDLAFLIRHAPQPVTLRRADDEGDWEATVGPEDPAVTSSYANTPEDALALACNRAHYAAA